MVCASNLASAPPPTSPIATWTHPVRMADWSQKDQPAATFGLVQPGPGPVLLGSGDVAPKFAQQALLQGVPEGQALQLGAMQLVPVPVVMCGASGQLQQAVAWPTYNVAAQEATYSPSDAQALLHPIVEQLPQLQQPEQAAVLSASAKRRLRRQRAAERSAQALSDARSATGSEPASPVSGSSVVDLDCAALTKALEAGGEARADALAAMKGVVAQLALEREGCRLVQAAVQLADRALVTELLAELHGHVLELLASQHGNYVLQTIVTAMPSASSGFVVQELLGSGAEVARHRFGCRVICRLVEHSGSGEGLAALLEELLAEAADLCQHPFAHYVMECMLEHLPEHRPRIAEALREDLRGNACHRCAGHVLEAILAHCSGEEQQALVLDLLGSGSEAVLALARHQYGSFVLRALLQVPCSASDQALAQIAQATSLVASTKQGQRLLQDLGL